MSSKFIDQMVKRRISERAYVPKFECQPIPSDPEIIGLEENARVSQLMGFAYKGHSELFSFFASRYGIPAGCVPEVMRKERLNLESAGRLWKQFCSRGRWLCEQHPQWRRLVLINNLSEHVPPELTSKDRMISILLAAEGQPDLATKLALAEYQKWKPTERDFLAANWPIDAPTELLEKLKLDRRASTRQLAVRNLARRSGTDEQLAASRLMHECFQNPERWSTPADISPFELGERESIHSILAQIATRHDLDVLVPDFKVFAKNAKSYFDQLVVKDFAVNHPTSERMIALMDLPHSGDRIFIYEKDWSALPASELKIVFDRLGFNKPGAHVPDHDLIGLWSAMAPWSEEVEKALLNHWAGEVRRMRIYWLPLTVPALAVGCSTHGLQWLLEQLAKSGLQANSESVRHLYMKVQLRIHLEAAYSSS